MKRIHLGFIVLALIVSLPSSALADNGGPSPVEQKLRDALRSTMLQLRDAQSQLITVQAAQTQSDAENKDLSAKVDALTGQLKTLTDQAAADQAASAKTIADLKQNNVDLVTQMVDALSTQINSLDKAGPDSKAALDKAITSMKTQNPDLTKALDQYNTDIQLWTTGYDQYVALANRTETERAKLAVQNIMLGRVVADRETKNLELYQLGNEILDRYAKFSLGDALSAKEPFTGISRVKLQEYVQDYKDKLTAQKIAIGQPPTMESAIPDKNTVSAAQTPKP